MSKSTIGLRRSGLAAVATTSLVMGAIFAGAGIASADADFDFTRLAGGDRYETSADIAEAFGAADTAILASGEPGHYPDALSANFLAGVEDAPVLLTMENDTPQSVLDRLEASGVDNVIIVGGELAVSAAQEQALKDAGYTVTRESGQTRFDTNAEIIAAGANNESSDTALIATGLAFPDALAGGPAAYKQGMPIGLSNDADMPDQVIAALKAANVNKAIILGGELRVPASVAAELEANDIDVVTRLAGQSRSATAVAIAEYGITNWGFNTTGVNVASGRAFGDGADALAGGPLTGKQTRPLLITENETTAGAATTYLEDHANTLTDGVIFGGNLAITTALEGALEDAAQSVTGNQSFSVTPTDKATKPASTTAAPNQGSRTYSVSGLDATKKYNVALLNAADVKVDANSQVTFADSDSNNLADGTDGTNAPSSATIEVVNGVGASGTEVNGVTPTNGGGISFSVDSEDYDDIIPVVWADDTSDNAFTGDALDLKVPATANAEAKAPVESFGVGGETVWTPGEAANGTITNAKVVSVDGNSAVINDAVNGYETVTFDSGDVYTYDGTNPTSMATFLQALSAGDTIAGTYSRNFQSTFDLADDVPGTPSNVAVQVGNLDNTASSNYDAKVTWSAPNPTDGLIDHYHVTIYTVDSNGKVTTTVQDETDTAGTETNATLNNLPNGNYAATVYAVSQTGTDGDTTQPVKFNVQKGDVDTTKPTINSATLTNGGSAVAANIDNGDTITLQFSEGVKIATDSAMRFTDAEGEIFQVTNGTGSAWTVGNYTPTGGTQVTNGQITIVLSADPVKVGGVAGSTAGAQVPGTITAFSSTVTDLSGNAVDLANSSDKTIDTPLG